MTQNHRPLKNLKQDFPKSPNSYETIDVRKGLDIQPFIFALTAALPDLDAHIGDGLYQRKPTYEHERLKICGLTQTLQTAGYSNKGTPYWVGPGGPSLPVMRQLVDKAEDCIDLLNDRLNDVKRSQKSEQVDALRQRYLGFTQACEGITLLADRAEIEKVQADQRSRIGIGYMCALA
jgi:hypothetical protein